MSTLFDLSAKIALITGSASGLGKAMAQGLAQHGARVVLNGRSGERLDAARREFAALDLEVHTACFDIYDQDAVAAGLERIAREVGDIDILVNNVGFRDRRDVDDFAVGDIDTMLSKNLGAPFELARRVAKPMARNGWGRIINLTSVVANIAGAGDATYVAAKGGLESLTRALAVEYGRHGITVNAISPGFFKTEPNAERANNKALNEWLAGRTALGRWAEPAELAGIAVFLASDAASYITGQTVQVDGGMSIHL